jgi:hypothetical protein
MQERPPTQRETWNEIVEFFDDFSTYKNCGFLKPFLESVVKPISVSEFSNRLFASQSLSHLVITVIETWPERTSNYPHVVVAARPDGTVDLDFLVPLSASPRNNRFDKERISCELLEEAHPKLVPLLQRLIAFIPAIGGSS